MPGIACVHCDSEFFAPGFDSSMWDGGVLCPGCKEVTTLDDL